MKVGNLRIADLARWFDRPHATVSTWVKEGRQPSGGPTDVEHFHALLNLLEQLISKKKGFPVPRLSPARRIEHVSGIRQRLFG